MLNALLERLTYALLGLVFGAVLGLLSWFSLYHLQVHFQVSWPYTGLGSGFELDMVPWIRNTGVVFAVLGFLLKERAGTWVGRAFTVWFDFERWRWSLLMLGVIVVLRVLWHLYA